ncbi:hypothetical protein ACF1BQ_017170 [Bradyrhizobium sp. RDT10]
MLAMSVVLGLASLPATSLADDIKPKAPETAFSGKLRPDILGISTESNAESARAIFDSCSRAVPTPRPTSSSRNSAAPAMSLH